MLNIGLDPSSDKIERVEYECKQNEDENRELIALSVTYREAMQREHNRNEPLDAKQRDKPRNESQL